MTWKQLLIGIIIVSVVLSLLMLGLIGVIKYRPDLLGIKEQIDTAKIAQNQKPKKIQPLKPVYIEPTVHISQKQLAFFGLMLQVQVISVRIHVGLIPHS